MRYRTGLTLAFFALAACAHRGDIPTSRSSPTLFIENAAAAVGAVNASSGVTRWHIAPGQTECKVIVGASTDIIVQAQSIGGGAAGPVRYQTGLQSGPGCWYWRLGDTNASSSLWGCEQQRPDTGGGA
jgi:hypothetical protein